ncbi:MAG: hypothetical protein WCQ72_01505 [Eubacteriales bacterium]
MDYENENPKKGFTVGKLIKWIIIALILFVYGLFMLRICSQGEPESMKRFYWTQSSIELYKSSPDTFSAAVSKPDKDIDDAGLFSVSSVYYMPQTGEIQLSVRYNNSTVKKIQEDYSLDAQLAGEIFVYMLTDENGVTYTSYSFTSAKKFVHNYRRVVFGGVDFTSCGAVTLDIFYINDVNRSHPMASFIIYDPENDGSVLGEKLTGTAPSQPDKLYASPAYLTSGAAE